MNITLKGHSLRNFLTEHRVTVLDVAKAAHITPSAVYRMTSDKPTSHHPRVVSQVLNAIEKLTGEKFDITASEELPQFLLQSEYLPQSTEMTPDDLLLELEFQMWRIRCYHAKYLPESPFIGVIDALIDTATWRDSFPEYERNPNLPIRFITQDKD